MKNSKIHNYILYFLNKVDKTYNKDILLYYDKKCNRVFVQYYPDKAKYILNYGDILIEQAKVLGKLWRYQIRYVLLHEIGHMVHTVPYETFNEKVFAEYSAERFALNYLKEHFPKNYRWAVKEGYALLQNPKWAKCKSEKHYRIAFENIIEYNE